MGWDGMEEILAFSPGKELTVINYELLGIIIHTYCFIAHLLKKASGMFFPFLVFSLVRKEKS